jgi:hypothetical protein
LVDFFGEFAVPGSYAPGGASLALSGDSGHIFAIENELQSGRISFLPKPEDYRRQQSRGMASFANPNSPVQPQKGVYGWYARKDGEDPITIYVGNAGGRKSLLPKGTLNRGVSELQRNTLKSN